METSIFHREPRPCIMARLHCKTCGPVRMALAPQDDPLTALDCPYCFHPSRATVIGSGSTIRNLPYFELEANLRDYMGEIDSRPAQPKERPQIATGNLVLYCEEEHIIHLAKVGEIHTNLKHLSQKGFPSITFQIGPNETEPIPHISSNPDSPPWWCFSSELAAANKIKSQTVTDTVTVKPAKAPRKKRRENV